MGWWQVSADTLAASRFIVSPLAEATASLMVLASGTAAHPGERAWLDAHQPAYTERLAADPVDALLVRAALRPGWIAGLLTIPPAGQHEPAFGEELTRLRAIPPEAARAELAEGLCLSRPRALLSPPPRSAPTPARRPPPLGGRLSALLDRSDLAQRAAGLLAWVWRETVLPSWPRRRRILEADVVARTATLSQGGLAAALAGMRPGMRWLGEGRLQINAYDYPPRDISGAQLLFIPVTPSRGWVSWDMPHRYAVMYPCAGVLAEADRAARGGGRGARGRGKQSPQTLGALLGPARAGVLVLLDTPKSTTQLVALTGQGLGSVGRHLKILLDARLVQRRRAGRSVLYYRTAAGDTLVAAQQSGGGRGARGRD